MTDPTFSVFTPSHDVRFLKDAYDSLLAQDYQDWEWVVLLNGDASKKLLGRLNPDGDDRIKVHSVDGVNGVGQAKELAVERCKGRYLVELDHDDLLEPTALSELLRAFQDHPDASLVYSTFTQITEQGDPHPDKFGEEYGWTYREEGDFLVPSIMQPTPHNVSLIWFAPNHVRAFTREAYEAAGGYDPDLDILDDQDLMCRLYQQGEFVPIDKMLYRQRLHTFNTQLDLENNARIQAETWDIYEHFIWSNADVWAERLDLNTVNDPDEHDLVGYYDMDSDYGLIRQTEMHTFSDPHEYMMRVHRALAPNGLFLSETPYWGPEFFKPYMDQGLFQISRMRVYWRDGIPYVQANLIAIKKGGARDGGIQGWH